jgi:hypothetical protein
MDNSPNFNRPELPKPQAVAQHEQNPQGLLKSPESSPAPAGERVSQAQGAISQAVQADDTSQTAQATQPGTNTIAQPQIDGPILADDNDVIEKEWVQKAKDIVAKTRNDPREQSHQVLLIRKDYIKKRYSKDLVTPNETTS